MSATGTNGPLSLGYQLSGDTDQFRVAYVLKMDGYPRTAGCGATISTTEVTPCLAEDVAAGGYTMLALRVEYAPTALGSHSVTLTPYTNNGTALPEPITFTGTGAMTSSRA